MEPMFFEDVKEGAAIPHEVRLEITTRRLVKWACVAGDYFEIHYDKDYALAVGLPGIIVHGPLRCALLARLLTEWAGDQGMLRKLACRHRKMDFPGDTLISKGRTLRKYQEGALNLVDCEVWIENQEGQVSTPGNATVSLPSRRNG